MVTVDMKEVNKVFNKRHQYNGNDGVDVLISGKPGSGKTNALARTAVKNKNKYGDTIVWRSSDSCQWSIFTNIDEKLVLWLKQGLDYKLKHEGKYVDIEDYVDEVKVWDDYDKLVANLDKDRINLVQTTPYNAIDLKQHAQFCKDWLNILQAMNRRLNLKQHISVLFDEFPDMAPSAASGEIFNTVNKLKGLQAKFRKNHVSTFYATHRASEVHWMLRSKIRWFLYMRGAKPVSDSKVNYGATKNLDIGQGYLEYENFEYIERFKFLGEEKEFRANIDVRAKEI